MASLNLSTNGPAIKNSYQKVVDAPAPTGAAASSPTYGQWAVYSVQAPLANAFQNDSTKESLLKVQTTGEGELTDLIEELSDGRIQFAYAKVKDPNSGLPKSVLVAWCGEGVPERTKGYFTSHLTAVSKLLHGYHVQITARSDRDLTPESIIKKVADASGANYSGGPASTGTSRAPPPPTSKPVFMPSKVGGAGNFNPLNSRARPSEPAGNTDSDGWGEDAPQVTRSQLEKVQPAYKPTKVNMAELTSQRQEPSRFTRSTASNDNSDVVRGGYQPIGKVDLNAIRREAREKGDVKDDRPSTVKGAYEPIGKVDIAAIRAKAQGAPPPSERSAPPQDEEERPKSLADRSTAFQQQERLTSLPKPKVANKFAGAGSAYTGAEKPSMGGVGKTTVSAAPVGAASRSFADQAGKTPAQLWAEKKAREGGGGASTPSASSSQPASVTAQKSGGWQSGYAGKKWGAVQTTKTGTSNVSNENAAEERVQDQEDQEEQEEQHSAGGGNIASRFSQPPPLDSSSKPNAPSRGGVAMPGLPTRGPSLVGHPAEEHVDLPTPPPQPRSPSPEPASSPVRLVKPVSRTAAPEPLEPAAEEETIPIASIASRVPELPADDGEDEDAGRNAAQAAAQATFGEGAATADPGAAIGGKRALIQFDYEKAEDNEIELVEGEYVTDIEMVDEDWWMGRNSKGETGLFPSNYVELVGDESDAGGVAASIPAPAAAAAAPPGGPPSGGAGANPTATAQFDYEAAEDNELSFPEGAKITDVEFPDEDWWLGVYGGKQGLFPSNYVQLDE